MPTFSNHYKEYRDRIYTHFVYRTGDQELAEDLASTTFLKAYEAWPRYDDARGAFSTWIYTIAHRVLLDYYRKAGREVPTDFSVEEPPEMAPAEDPSWQFDRDVTLTHAYEAIDMLSPLSARCVTYRYVDDLSTREIAALTELKETSVRQHLSRGMKQVRTYLSTHYKYQTI